MDEVSCVIRQAVPTTNGFLRTLRPEMLVSPVHADRFFGGAYATETPDGTFPCVGLKNGSGFTFSPVPFETGVWRLSICCSAKKPVKARMILDGRPAGAFTIPGTGEFVRTEVRFTSPGGTMAPGLEILFAEENADCRIEALRFEKETALFFAD